MTWGSFSQPLGSPKKIIKILVCIKSFFQHFAPLSFYLAIKDEITGFYKWHSCEVRTLCLSENNWENNSNNVPLNLKCLWQKLSAGVKKGNRRGACKMMVLKTRGSTHSVFQQKIKRKMSYQILQLFDQSCMLHHKII